MTINPSRLLTIAFSIALVACTTRTDQVSPAAENVMPLKSLAGSKLHYSDLHSRNTYTFKSGGKFVFDYVHHGSGDSGERDGAYKYRVSGPGKARVDFDDGDFMLMEFDSPLSGICIFDGDVRRYAFKITRSAGE